ARWEVEAHEGVRRLLFLRSRLPAAGLGGRQYRVRAVHGARVPGDAQVPRGLPAISTVHRPQKSVETLRHEPVVAAGHHRVPALLPRPTAPGPDALESGGHRSL